jgi:hypothetical protein
VLFSHFKHYFISCTGRYFCKGHENCGHEVKLTLFHLTGDWQIQECGLHSSTAAVGLSKLTPFVKGKISELSQVGGKPRAIQAQLSKVLLELGLRQIQNAKVRIQAELMPLFPTHIC